jgi:hypothetical protein
VDSVFIHIGLSIEDHDFLKPDLKQFLERFFLELMLMKQEKANNYLNEESVKIIYHDSARILTFTDEILLRFFSNDTCSVILHNGSRFYSIALIHPGKDTLFTKFPANVFLIKGMDKKELDDLMTNDFTRIGMNNFKLKDPETQRKPVSSSSSFSFLPDFKQKEYFQNNDYFISETERQNQTLANIFFNTGAKGRNYHLDLTYLKYGNQKSTFALDLIRFVSFFAQSHQLYYYIVKTNSGKYEGQLIFYEPDLHYYHSLEITAESSSPDSFKDPITVKFLAFISINETVSFNDHFRYKFGKEVQKVIKNKKK